MKEVKFYRCNHCGNIIEKIVDSGVSVICCGEEMTELVPNTTDAATEKHVPVVAVEGSKVTVQVGSVAHPMTEEHYIQWICLVTSKGIQRVNLSSCNRKNIENLALAGAFDSFEGIKSEDFFMPNAKGETFTEVLVRYGNKFQLDKAAAATSLFGGDNMVEVATPEIISAPGWSDLDRLNKERDLVGIYLSAHPLDEYRIILENVCNVRMLELTDLTPLQNRDLVMGGIVTGFREGYTKTGKPYGIAKVEDYSGSAEFAFFGNEWVEKKNFFNVGMFLYMKGKCQPKQWRQDEYEVKVNSIELLPDVKDEIIEQLTVSVPLSEINDEFIEEFSTLVKANPGKVLLNFYVKDDEGQHISLAARDCKINLQKDIIAYLNSQSMLSYKIN